MNDTETINAIHGELNDIFMDLHSIAVCDETGREAKQHAFLCIVRLRRQLQALGHTMPAPMKRRST